MTADCYDTPLTSEQIDDAEERALPWLVDASMKPITRETAITEELLALDVIAMVDELRVRRAQDLTAEEYHVLAGIQGSVQYDWLGGETRNKALAVLVKLLARRPA